MPTARPLTSANGRKTPLLVTSRVWPARIGSRDVQPSQDRLERAEELRARDRRGRWPPGEIDETVVPHLELGGDRRQASTNVTQRESGPAGQVPVARGPVTREKASCELGKRAVAIDPVDRPEPVAHQDERLLPADHGTSHRVPAQR